MDKPLFRPDAETDAGAEHHIDDNMVVAIEAPL
jgi:hypothetical protein